MMDANDTPGSEIEITPDGKLQFSDRGQDLALARWWEQAARRFHRSGDVAGEVMARGHAEHYRARAALSKRVVH